MLAVALVVAAACGDDDGSGGAADAGGSGDAGGPVCDPTTQPPAESDCITDVCGNEMFVGMTCTEGGGECNDNGFTNAFLCTRDARPEASLNICTKACVEDSDCGEGAVCQGDPDNPTAGMGCVPEACAD